MNTTLKTGIRLMAALAVLAMAIPAFAQGRGNRGGQGQAQQDDGGRGDRGGRGGRGGQRGGFGGGGFGGRGGFAAFGRGGIGNFSVEQDFLRRDIPIFVEEMKMDQSQRMIFEILFTDYEGAFRELMEFYQTRQGELVPELAPDVQRQQEQLRDQLTEINQERRRMAELLPEGPERDQVLEALGNRSNQLREQTQNISQQQRSNQAEQGVFESIARIQSEWTAQNAALRDEFIENVLVVLMPDQQELWPQLDRRLRREKTLTDGQLSGERVNLFSVVRDQHFEPETLGPIEPVLGEYGVTLDEALKRRNSYLETSVPMLTQAYQEQDFSRGLGILNQQTALRKAVRDVNDTYAQLLESALSETDGAIVRTAYRRSAYPRIFQTTRAQRAFDAAKVLPDLLPEVVEAITQLEASYLLELGTLNERLISLTKRYEPENTRKNAEWLVARISGQDMDRPEDPIRDSFNSREDLDDRYIEMLKALLTPEQVSALPGNIERRGRGGRGGNRGDGGGRGGGGERQAEFMAQFDTDGDGEISESERAAIRERFQGQGGGRRGQRGGGGGG